MHRSARASGGPWVHGGAGGMTRSVSLEGFQVGEQDLLQRLGLVAGPCGVPFQAEGLQPAGLAQRLLEREELELRGGGGRYLVANRRGLVTLPSRASPGEKETS